ncbi:family 16 glycosylhydrolase [Actinoplanes sp. L3-i22]|uniref:carbohydrate-binding protein n=1 Tax=Actinoplanes sp. L3-i22 TaxID=2836373 RepID=UPI001C7977CF|nr:family 16 glycosylhydrolase [Actinoplanes sp. L3-i22]BCY14814.1 hypothetical protein L3i22_099020 [Actinoplanes sp. L3-i22]
MGHGARWLRSLVAAAVVVSGLAVSGPARAETVTRTVFSDDFGASRGAGVDTAKWSGNTWNAWQDGNGRLVLDSYSAINTATAFSQSSGHASARIQAGYTDAAWEAFSVLSASGGAIAGRVDPLGDGGTHDGDFHTYAIDWTRSTFVWSVDGRQAQRLTPDAAGQPFRLAVNLGGGGRRSDGILVDSVTVTVKLTVVPPAAWTAFANYKVGDRVTYKGATWAVKEQHTALPGWQPGLVPQLFQKL